MQLKLQLLDDEDLKRIEDTIAKALVRALRTVLKEGTISGYTAPKPESFADAPPAPNAVPQPPTGAPQPIVPNRPAWAQPAAASVQPAPERQEKPVVFGMHMGEPQSPNGYRKLHPIAEAITPTPIPVATPAAELRQIEGKAKRKTMAEYCKSVDQKPAGYIPSDEAYELMDVPREQAAGYLRQWIQAGDVKGVIVCGVKGMAPTKGLPGRLHVEKQPVIARDKLRQENAAEMRRMGRGNWNGRRFHDQQAAAAE